jgi:hypothetical protein
MKFDESKSSGQHGELAKLVGDWSGMTKTWFERDVLADESPMTGTISPILDGRFVIHEYRGEIQDKPCEGVAIYGFDLATNKFQAAWVDSFHMSTGILFSEGDTGDKFSVLGSYFAGEGEPRWGWRTEIDVIDDDSIVITAFNIMPGEQEQKATETRYTRTA